VHPAELAADDRKSMLKEWHEVFHDENIEPLFDQLDRNVYELRDVDRGTTITRFKLRSVGYDRINAFATTHDWSPILEDMDGGGPLTTGYPKTFARDGLVATAMLGSGASVESVYVERGSTRMAFSNIHPVTASEILRTVEMVTGKPQEAVVVTAAGIEKGT